MDLQQVGVTFVGSHMATQETFLTKYRESVNGETANIVDMALSMIGIATAHLESRVNSITMEDIFLKVGKEVKPLIDYLPAPTPNMGIQDLIGLHTAFEEVLFCLTAKYSADKSLSGFQAYKKAAKEITSNVDVHEIHRKYAPYITVGDSSTEDFLGIYVNYVNFLKNL
jgi:hypothetical protein